MTNVSTIITNNEDNMYSWNYIRNNIMACMCSNNTLVFRDRGNGQFVHVNDIFKYHLVQEMVIETIKHDMIEEDSMDDNHNTVEFNEFNVPTYIGAAEYEGAAREYKFLNEYTEEEMVTTDRMRYLALIDAYKLDWQEAQLSEDMMHRQPSGPAVSDDYYYTSREWCADMYDKAVANDKDTEWIEDRLVELETERLADVHYPYYRGDHSEQTIPAIEEYRNAHVVQSELADHPMMVGKWVDHTPMNDMKARNLHRTLFMLNAKLDRAKSWSKAAEAIEAALASNKAEKWEHTMSGKTLSGYVANSSACGYKANITIKAFMMYKHMKYGDDMAYRIANMWKSNGRVAMDYANAKLPAKNKYGVDVDTLTECINTNISLFAHIMS